MADFSDALNVAASGMRSQAARIRYVSENIANNDTPGYRRKTVSFEEEIMGGQRTGAVTTGRLRLDQAQLPQVYDPDNPLSNEAGYYEGSAMQSMTTGADPHTLVQALAQTELAVETAVTVATRWSRPIRKSCGCRSDRCPRPVLRHLRQGLWVAFVISMPMLAVALLPVS
jgi:flagellar basal-body rod protein FlgC